MPIKPRQIHCIYCIQLNFTIPFETPEGKIFGILKCVKEGDPFQKIEKVKKEKRKVCH